MRKPLIFVCVATCSKKESWLSLLHFFLSQSHAAAQATAMAMGCYHTVALLTIDIEKEDPTVATSSIPFHVCAFGRGENRISIRPCCCHKIVLLFTYALRC